MYKNKDLLKETIKSDLIVSLQDKINSNNDNLNLKINELEKILKKNTPKGFEDKSDLIINKELRNLNYENRPQDTSNTIFNENFKDLSNYDLHRIKKYIDKEKNIKKKTILDQTIGETMDKTVNFISFSHEGYMKALYKAEILEDVYDNDKSIYQIIKVHLIAFSFFMREDKNITYIGIILIFFSMILYFMNITTS